jgi:hypothetical protein
MMDLKMGFGVAGEVSCFPNYLSLSLFCRCINSKTQKHSAASKTKSRSAQLLKRVFFSRKVESLQWVLSRLFFFFFFSLSSRE